MSVALNHTIVWATDPAVSAQFLASILDLKVGPRTGRFHPLRLTNDVTLDYAQATDITPQHYAFLVDDTLFDTALAKINSDNITYYADPTHTDPGHLNNYNGGRGFYFSDPDGHSMELLTAAE